jgi:hypothetical protein
MNDDFSLDGYSDGYSDSNDDIISVDPSDFQDSSNFDADFDSEFDRGFSEGLNEDYSYDDYSRDYEARHSILNQDPRVQFIEELSEHYQLDSESFMQEFYDRRSEVQLEERIQAEYDYLIDAGVSPGVAETLIIERLEHEEMVAQQEQQQYQENDINQFLHDFRSYEGQEWDDSIELPPEIVLACQNYGMTLSDAYRSYIKVNHGNGIIRDEFLMGFLSI